MLLATLLVARMLGTVNDVLDLSGFSGILFQDNYVCQQRVAEDNMETPQHCLGPGGGVSLWFSAHAALLPFQQTGGSRWHSCLVAAA